MFRLSCPHCRAGFKVRAEHSGARGRCPHCKGQFFLPPIDAARGPLGGPWTVAPAAAFPSRAETKPAGPDAPFALTARPRTRRKSAGALTTLVIGVAAAGFAAAVAVVVTGGPKAAARTAATKPAPPRPAGTTRETTPDPPQQAPPEQEYAFDKAIPYGDLKRSLLDAVKPLTLDVSKPLDRETRNDILRWAILELQGEESFHRVVNAKRGPAFYSDLFGCPALMDGIMCSGDLPSPSRTIESLYVVHGDDRQGILNDPVLRNLAAAIAAWGFDNYRAHEAYLFWKDCWEQGLLHREFGTYQALEMRFVVEKTGPECAASMQRYHNLPMTEIGNIAWLVPYQGENIFQFDPLSGPWEHVWCWPAMGRDCGGVCGTVSYYGSAGINARGLMSTPGEQPGHCAFEYRRLDGRWVIGNYVGRPTGTHTRVLPLGNFLSFEYIDDMFADADGQNRAQELEYLAVMAHQELHGDASSPTAYDERIAEIHRAALRACPLHFNALRAWGRQIADDPGSDSGRMDRWVDHVLKAMGDHPENAWLLIQEIAIPCVKKIGGNDAVLATYTRAHASLHDVPAGFWRPVDMRFDDLLDRMAKTLDDDKAAVFRLFEAGLDGQKDSPGCFGDLLKWGGARFLADRDYADRSVSAVTACFRRRGDTDGLKGYIRDATRRAQAAEDVAGFRAACRMRDELEPPRLTPLKPKFTGDLLSADGLFRIENYHDSWPCTEHDRVIQEVEEGRARTSNGPAWGKVVLAGDCLIEGIYVRGSEHTGWQMPLTVSVSADGKQWKEVFKTDEPAREWSIDLSKEPVHGRFVKVERAVSPNHFELEKVLVYGKRLY